MRTAIRRAGAWALALVSVSTSALAQGPAYISDIRRPQPPGGSFESNVGVENVTVILARDKQARRGFKDFSLNYRDEIRIRRTTPPTISKLIISFRDNNRERVDLAEGAVYQLEEGGINVEEGVIGWIVGRFRTTTKYLQAIARGTQYGFLVEGEKTKLFVWEGSVEVSNRSGAPKTVTVAAKQLTEAIGSGQPSAPRVPRFDEIKELLLFGLEVDPDVRVRIRDERSQLQLHQDLIRAEFEVAARPTEIGPLVSLGNLNLVLGRYDRALDFFNQAEKFSPRSGDIYNGRGIVFAMRPGSGDALAEFTTALKREKASRFYNNLGVYYLDHQQWGKAIDELRAAVRRDRYNDVAYNALGVALLQAGQTGAQLSESEAALERAVTIKEHPVPLNNLGTVSLLRGKTDEAQAKYQRAAQLDPTDAAVANNLGVSFLKQAKYEEAIQQFLTAIQAGADDPTAYCNLGLIHHAKPELRASIRQRVEALPPPRAELASVRQAFQRFLDEVETLGADEFERACDKFKAVLPARR